MTEAYMRLKEENAKLSARVERLTAALKEIAMGKELCPVTIEYVSTREADIARAALVDEQSQSAGETK